MSRRESTKLKSQTMKETPQATDRHPERCRGTANKRNRNKKMQNAVPMFIQSARATRVERGREEERDERGQDKIKRRSEQNFRGGRDGSLMKGQAYYHRARDRDAIEERRESHKNTRKER